MCLLVTVLQIKVKRKYNAVYANCIMCVLHLDPRPKLYIRLILRQKEILVCRMTKLAFGTKVREVLKGYFRVKILLLASFAFPIPRMKKYLPSKKVFTRYNKAEQM